jgi:hypothetical protein
LRENRKSSSGITFGSHLIIGEHGTIPGNISYHASDHIGWTDLDNNIVYGNRLLVMRDISLFAEFLERIDNAMNAF